MLILLYWSMVMQMTYGVENCDLESYSEKSNSYDLLTADKD